jgi:carbonic anhydrase/acetyltransferase-like protein (isoleucine patch superfamily)
VTNPIELCIPRETANDDVVTLVRWYPPDGATVRAGERIFSIETSKAILDIEAPADGWLEILHPEGAQVAVGQAVARLHAQAPISAGATRESARAKAHPTTQAPVTAPISGTMAEQQNAAPAAAWFSAPAKNLIERHQLNSSDFDGLSLVRSADVRRLLEKRLAPPQHDKTDELTIHQSDMSLSPIPDPDSSCRKGLWADARVSAGQRGHGILWLALNYFFRNYLLGLLVRIAPRGLLIPLHRLRGVKIGTGCYVDPTALLETAYPEQITIGDDVRITARAVIMAHIKGPHYHRQHNLLPAQVKPVVLENHCFIGVNAVILPGVTVGQAAVVASSAVVTTNVPPLTMAAGNPATVIKRYHKQNNS